MKKVLSLILIFAIMCSAVCACKQRETPPSALQRFSNVIFDAFDTVITITAYCKDEADFNMLFDFAQNSFVHYHKLFDIYNHYEGITNIKDLNDKAAIAPVNVDADLIDLLNFGKDIYNQTEGRVNIAMGSVLELWHDAREKANNGYNGPDLLPSEDALVEAANHCDIESLIINNATGTVHFSDKDLKIDVGAIAKGYATEKVKEQLVQNGYNHFLINAGGNVTTYGTKPDGSNWTIGIQNPDANSKESYIKTVSIETNSVVTSGVYERNFEYGGKVYHHIIDPDTLSPENRFLSVSIITEASGLADGLSTAVFNMDLEKGQAFIDSLDGVEAMWILNDKTQVFSNEFEKYIK